MLNVLIDNKFIPIQIGNNYNKNNGWFGNTVYHPDTKWVKDNKSVIIGIGSFGNMMYYRDNTKNKIVDNSICNDTRKYIILLKNNEIVYRSNNGIFPSNNFLLNYINS